MAKMLKIGDCLDDLSKLPRYFHRVCDDGDGYTDEWDDLDDDGDYVHWEDIEKIIKKYLPDAPEKNGQPTVDQNAEG